MPRRAHQRLGSTFALAALCLASASTSRAQSAPHAPPPAQPPSPAQAPAARQPQGPQNGPPQAQPDRELPAPVTPDLGHRGTSRPEAARGYSVTPGIESEDVLLALPRAVLMVPELALDVAFLPLRGLLYINDEYRLYDRAKELLYFDAEHRAGWTPTFSFVGAQGLSGGARVFHHDLFGHDEEIELSARYGGRYTQFYELSFSADTLGEAHLYIETIARYEANPALLFGGFGIVEDEPEVAPDEGFAPRESNRQSYFAHERELGVLRLGHLADDGEGRVLLGASAILNHRHSHDNDDDRTQTAAVYDVASLPGFREEITTLELNANLVVDHRRTEGLDSSGAYLEAFFGGVPKLEEHRYLHYGAEAAYTFDLFHGTRLLTLRTALEAVDGHRGEIPFTDLPRLGGPHRLRGYRLDRYRDKRAALASVEYHYPIHRNVLGQIFVDAGYVSQGFEDLYDLGEWKVGYGGGLIYGGEDSVALRLDIAYGEDLLVFVTTELPNAFDGRSTQL